MPVSESAAPLSRAATARLRSPRSRGAFAPIDAARRQLGLLAVSDDLGQARIFWLVDLSTQVIEDSRFLAFGSLASHPISDAFSELARGRTVADACALTAEQITSLLHDDPLTPGVPSDATEFINQLQTKALAEAPLLKLLPKPEEKQVYERKRKQDWSVADQAWLPLSLLKKIGKVETVVLKILAELSATANGEIHGVNDDLIVKITYLGLSEAETAVANQRLQDALRQQLHPDMRVEQP